MILLPGARIKSVFTCRESQLDHALWECCHQPAGGNSSVGVVEQGLLLRQHLGHPLVSDDKYGDVGQLEKDNMQSHV